MRLDPLAGQIRMRPHRLGPVPDRANRVRHDRLPMSTLRVASRLLGRESLLRPRPLVRGHLAIGPRRPPADFLARLEIVDIAGRMIVEVPDIGARKPAAPVAVDRNTVLPAVHDRRTLWPQTGTVQRVSEFRLRLSL